MKDCLFCKIVAGELPSQTVYDSEDIMVFKDIHPQAPVHLLVIPKKHIANLDEMKDEDQALVARMMGLIRDLARREGLDKTGYRVVTNHGPDSGQEVDHLHFHLLGKRKLGPIG